jgi:BolA protein
MKLLLEEALTPLEIVIVDESARHHGHAGARPEGETHYRLRIVSAAFEGLSRVARARKVHELLGPEFADGLHALALDLKTPAEAERERGNTSG